MVQRVEFEGMIHEFPDDFSEKEISDSLATMPRRDVTAPQPPVEVEGPDGTIFEFPAGTSRDIMSGALRKHYGGPAPAAPTADNITRDLVNRTPAPADKPVAPPWYVPQNPGRALKLGFQAVGSGLASVAGMPVDLAAGAQNIATAGLNKLTGADLPYATKPVGGSAWIKEKASDAFTAAGAPPVEKTTMSPRERMAYNVADYGTQFIAPAGALAARAPKLAAEAAQGFRPSGDIATRALDRLTEPYAENAARTFAGDVAGGMGAGVGATVAQEHAPNSPMAEALAALVGGVGGVGLKEAATSIGRGVAGRVRAGIDPNVPRDPVTGAAVRTNESESAARLLQDMASNPSVAARNISDNAANFRSQDMPVPSTGLIAGDTGLNLAENTARTRNAAPFIERDQAMRGAATDRVESLRAPDVDQTALNARAGEYARQRTAPAEARLQAAQDRAQAVDSERGTLASVFRAMDTQAAQEQASGTMRNAVEGPYREWRTAKNQAFEALDPDRTKIIGADGVIEAATRVRENVNALGPQAQQLPGEFLNAIDKMAETGGRVPLGDLVDMRKYLATATERARETGNFTLADNLGALRAEINRTVGQAPEAAAANELYRQGAERFRPTPVDPMTELSRAIDRGRAPPPSTTGKLFLSAPENADALLRVIDGLPTQDAAIGAVRDYMRAGFARVARNGQIDGNAANEWVKQNSAVLNRFPAIRAEFDGLVQQAQSGEARAASARAGVNSAQANLEAAQRGVQFGAAGALINGKEPRELAASLLASPYGAERKAAEIGKIVGNDPSAKAAWKAAVADVVADKVNQAARAGMNTAGPGPAIEANVGALEKIFLQHEKTLASVFAPEEMNRLRQAHAALEPLKNALLRGGAPGMAADGTENLWRIAEAGLKAKFGVLKGGGVLRTLRIAASTLPDNREAVAALVQRAWFDPELAAYLLTKDVDQLRGAAANGTLRRLVLGANLQESYADAER